ncbi:MULTISPECIES: tetratricopeptide repeat protein [unclassified Streptomyces]|uniref:tetratricopeptide repeat protein n=1 Tax=unclassified Streptomyces TaxID=2593676 RepID=UPI001660CD56|nr:MULTISPECIES: tetratricopeptide repeat protein [unclassified Streptomyces]MBD0707877.1 transcriptional regulator [Streptomyces sp. CBMA291]MBD0717578.1 transcriptional regulator [Streptomyces sp. CBMA370]
MAMSRAVPNLAFRRLRGRYSPAEFAAAVRRAAREIGEQVGCDARYIGRVEAGEIRCPNYAYERVFLHMFPGLSLSDLGFSAREAVRGRRGAGPGSTAPADITTRNEEESDVLRRAFMTSGSATLAAVSLGLGGTAVAIPAPRGSHRIGETEVRAVEDAVREIRLLDDRYGAEGLYQIAAQPLRAAYALLDSGGSARRSTEERLYAGAGELSLSVGWLAHDSGRQEDARSHYAEALSTARVAGNPALEAHAFCNTSFLARDSGRFREALRAAQAGLRAAGPLGSHRLRSLLSLREAGAWAGLGDRTACEQALGRAHGFFDRGPADGDPEWMSFFGEPEREALEAQCWSALGDWRRATRHAQRAAVLQNPHFARNLALYRTYLARDLAYAGRRDEAAAEARRVRDSSDGVASARVRGMLTEIRRVLAAP